MPYHEPVLLHESLDALLTDPDGVYVDGTVGGGGHAVELCRRLGSAARVLCFDADEDALNAARPALAFAGERVSFIHANVRTLKQELATRGIAEISGLLLDLGVSSYQLDEQSKGFSFREDGPLDMRMDRRKPLSAWHVVNGYEEEGLANVLWAYGEERQSRRIARRIVASRPVDSTGALSSIVESVVGGKFLVKSLARVFQAIRIEVNGELDALRQVLLDALDVVHAGGRIVVIAYHSLEDRVVKDVFRSCSVTNVPSGNKYVADRIVVPRLRLLTKRPVEPTPEEVAKNPRARSARLRAAERINVVS